MLLAHIATNCICVFKIVSYLLDLPERDEEDTQRAQINSYDTLWGETGRDPRFQLITVLQHLVSCLNRQMSTK